MSYPKMLYHPTEGAVIVPDAACESALPAGWSMTPPASVTSVAPTVRKLDDAMTVEEIDLTAADEPVDEALLPVKRKPGRPRKAD